MTTDCEAIRRHFDIAQDDLPMITPTLAPVTEERLAAGLKGAVTAMRLAGRDDGSLSVALRSIFRDNARREPHLGHHALEQSTARFDRAVRLAMTDSSN